MVFLPEGERYQALNRYFDRPFPLWAVAAILHPIMTVNLLSQTGAFLAMSVPNWSYRFPNSKDAVSRAMLAVAKTIDTQMGSDYAVFLD